MSSPAPLPDEIQRSAKRAELQKVVKLLRKGGLADALCSTTAVSGLPSTFTLLHAAACNGHLEMVRVLLKRGASVDLPSGLGNTALMGAAHRGYPFILLVLLQHSANPDLQGVHGCTALMQAALEGQEACVQALLQARANTELLDDQDGHTALMSAADQGHEPCVQALLRAKANIELLDDDGDTALIIAEARGHTATAKLIRQHAAPPPPAAAALAATPDAGEPAESSPAPLPDEIQRSAKRGELQKVVKWLRKGGLVDALCSVPTHGGGPSTATLLHIAAINGHLDMVRELLWSEARASTCQATSASPRSRMLRSTATTLLYSSSCSTRPALTCRTSTAAPP